MRTTTRTSSTPCRQPTIPLQYEGARGLTRLVDAVHAAGGLIAFQLAHGGRQCPKKVIGTPPGAQRVRS